MGRSVTSGHGSKVFFKIYILLCSFSRPQIHYIAQAGLELVIILLPPSSWCQDYRHALLYNCAGSFLSILHEPQSPGKKELQLRICVPQIGLWLSVSLGAFRLISDLCEKAQPHVGGATSEQVGVGYIRKVVM